MVDRGVDVRRGRATDRERCGFHRAAVVEVQDGACHRRATNRDATTRGREVRQEQRATIQGDTRARGVDVDTRLSHISRSRTDRLNDLARTQGVTVGALEAEVSTTRRSVGV